MKTLKVPFLQFLEIVKILDFLDDWMFVGSAMTLIIMGMFMMLVSIGSTFFLTKRCYQTPDKSTYARF